jgi:hypothetical protein
MSTRLTSDCHPSQGGDDQPAPCQATFTVDGQRGDLKFLTAGVVTLEADQADADSYHWQVTSSPPHCDYLLTGSTQRTAKLSMPGSGAYVVQLTVTHGDCVAQSRVILWVATPTRLYRIPADSEALRFDGSGKWAGDLARVIQHVDSSLPTPEQKAAMDGAHQPGEENPFATLEDLPEGTAQPGELTADELAAIRQAQSPSGDNPFVTHSALPPDEVTPEQKAALDAAQNPGGDNPFITQGALPEIPASQLNDDQVAAIAAAQDPGADNPFVTFIALPPDELTPGQKAALDAAQDPAADNPFVTRGALPEIPAPQLSDDQVAAIATAQDPSGDNPFVTHSALPPDELTPGQKAALDAADEPGADNPFVTQSALPEGATPQLSDEQVAAIATAQDPNADNPFVTHSALPAPQLSPDQEAAIDAAYGASATNRFVTQDEIITGDKKAAIDAAATANSANRFATLADLAPAGSFTRIVAAGSLDLSSVGSTSGAGPGRLEVVATLPERGVATLRFDGYQLAHKSNYLVQALPIRADAKTAAAPPSDPRGFRQFIHVQLVEFNEQGFELQMIRPLHEISGVPALGPCMIQVSELTLEIAEPAGIPIEQAARRYYELIQQRRYSDAWPMLSEDFKNASGLTTYEQYVSQWEESGPAILIGITQLEANADSATHILDVNYPDTGLTQKLRYRFVRSQAEGDPRFGYWLFEEGNPV